MRTASHELSVWMAEQRLSNKETAAKLDCLDNYLSRIRTGRARPGRDLAVKIEELTAGRVAAKAWGRDAR